MVHHIGVYCPGLRMPMPSKSDPPGSAAPTQRAKFEEAARQLGCEDDEAAFAENLRRVAGLGPRPMPKKATKPKSQTNKG